MVAFSFLTEGPAAAVKFGAFAVVFFTLMMLLARGQTSALEKRLRREQPAPPAEVPPVAAMSAPADAVARRDLLRALGRGARDGAFLGVGAATSLLVVMLSGPEFALRPWQGAWVRLNPWPAAFAAFATVVAIAAPVGAAAAVLARVLVRPCGRIRWGTAWLAAGIAVAVGSSFVRLFLPAWGSHWQLLMVAAAPAAAVYWDWHTRLIRGQTRQLAAAGKMPPEKARILQGLHPESSLVVETLPVLLLVGGVTAGHFAGEAAGRAIVSPAFAALGADLGGLIGRVIGALAGALLAAGLLRLYRVEDGAPWPGQGDRPYPRALAALYLAVAAVLVALWFL